MVARGEVWWVDFGPPRKSEPAGRRPVVIVSADRFNRSAISTVIVAVVTSNLRLADAPGNVQLDLGAGNLDRPSVVNVSQLWTLDRARLIRQHGTLDLLAMNTVSEGLRLALAL